MKRSLMMAAAIAAFAVPAMAPLTALAQDGDPFPKVLVVQADALQHLAGGRIDPAQRRLAAQAGALVEDAVLVDQPLREGRRVVGKDVDYTVRIDWKGGGGCHRCRRRLDGGRCRRLCGGRSGRFGGSN